MSIKFKTFKKLLITALIAVSLILTAYDWTHIKEIHGYLWGAGLLAGIGVLATEAAFLSGAFLMALSAGEGLPSIKKIHRWPSHIAQLRRNARSFAERVLTSRLFAVGFWLNFVGAVGTSSILIFAIFKFAPYTGIGVAAVIVIDLVATFGWRIPLEVVRRREVKHHGTH